MPDPNGERKIDWRTALRAAVGPRPEEPHPEPGELVAYRGGELPAEKAARIQDHLVQCSDCADLLLDFDVFAADASRAADGADEEPAPVVPMASRRPSRWRRWVPAAAALAAAVLLVVWLRPEPLPGYAPHLDGALRPTRSAGSGPEAEVPLLATGRTFAFRLLPETATGGPLAARAYLVAGGDLRVLSTATLESSADGVVSLEGTVGREVLLPAGDSELVLVAARPGSLPPRRRLLDELASGTSARGRAWVGFRQKLRVAERAGDSQPPGATASDEGPWIEYAGCRTILAGPVCVVPGDRRLSVWVRHPRPDDVRIAAGGRIDAPAVEVQDGHRFEVEVANEAPELVVEVRRDGRLSTWALALSWTQEPPWLTQALELYGRGDWTEVQGLLEPRASSPDPAEAGPALGLLARIERRNGDAGAGDRLYRQALEAHRRSGRLSDHVKDGAGLAYHLIQDRRFAEVRELLDSLPAAATGGGADPRRASAYSRGLLAERAGDLRSASAWTARAAREAERAGLARELAFADDLLARQLAAAGLTGTAAALRARMEPRIAELCGTDGGASAGPCHCARFDVNRAWAALLAVEAGAAVRDPGTMALLEGAEEVFVREAARGEGSCVFPDDLPNVRLNLALAALHESDLPAARRHLEEARVDPEELPRLALWQLDVEARIWLEEDQPERSLALYRELARRAELGSSPEAAWRAAYGEAAALEAAGRAGEAVAACARAERLLDRESLLVPMHGGRERFIAQRDRAATFCLALLLRDRRPDEALALVRRSPARALRPLQIGARLAGLDPASRAAWEETAEAYRVTRSEIETLAARVWKGLPGDQRQQVEEEIGGKRRRLRELLDRFTALAGGVAEAGKEPAAPAPGTVLLAYHPLPEGWAAFAADREGVTSHRIDPGTETDLESRSADALSAWLLAPFADKLRTAVEIGVIAYGGLRQVDFHALPFDGGLLLDRAPVVYRLDLLAAADREPSSSAALVVSGPGLLDAPAEVRQVRAAVEEHFELLEAASAPEVRRRLGDVTLFHYAGHAAYDEDGRGWGSHLALERGGRLTVDDVLALTPGPRWAVLSGCETGREAPSLPLASVGLAQAFLVAGSEDVVAATAEVPDADAAELMAALYRHWQPPESLAGALRAAQRERRDLAPESAWSAFRVLAR